MPVGITDPVHRLNIIETQQNALAKSRLPSQLYYFQLALSVFPTKILKSARNIHLSGMISNFNFPIKSISYAGHHMEHMFCGVGIFYGSTGRLILLRDQAATSI